MGKGVGAGKSFYIVHRIIEKLVEGGTVFAADTFGLLWPQTKAYVEKKWGFVLQDSQYCTFPESDIPRLHEVTPAGTEECTVLVVVDEAHGELNARDWADAKKKAFFKWLTQSRHDDTDVIFISQHMHNLDKQILRLATYVVRVRNMANWMILGLCRYWRKVFWVYRMDGCSETVLWKEEYKHDPAIFACYRSKSMRGRHKRSGEAVAKLKLSKSPESTKRKKRMRTILIIGALAVVLAALLGFKLWRDRAMPAASSSAVVASTPAPSKPVLSVTPPVPFRAGSRSATVAPVPETFWDTITEVFRGSDGATYLRSSVAEYRVGRMSLHGMVEAVSDGVAKILQPNGRTLYVVTHYEPRVVLAVPSTPAPVYAVGEMSARWEPVPSKLGDRESARIKAELERPVGGKR